MRISVNRLERGARVLVRDAFLPPLVCPLLQLVGRVLLVDLVSESFELVRLSRQKKPIHLDVIRIPFRMAAVQSGLNATEDEINR